MNTVHLLKLTGLALLFMVINVGVSILVVAFYAYWVNPGHPPEFYEQFASTYAPYSSIFAGMPLLFLITWWFTRGRALNHALQSATGIWLIYTIIDLVVVFTSGMTSRLAVFVVISTLAKLLAAWLGARAGAANQPRHAGPTVA